MGSANRCEIVRQRFGPALVERSDKLLDDLAGDFFGLFVFHLAFSREVIGSFSQDRGTKALRPQEKAEGSGFSGWSGWQRARPCATRSGNMDRALGLARSTTAESKSPRWMLATD